MRKPPVFLGFVLGFCLAGCAAKAPLTTASTYASSEYQSRELLGQSLFRSDQAVLSNEEIETILSSRIQLPQRAHLTILRLGRSDELLAWAFADGPENPLAPLLEHPRLRQVSWLPSLLVPKELSVPLLREAAARFQADLLLVYRTPCQQFRNYRWLGDDTARTYCVAEALLLDVRTGVIPFSTAATRRVEAREAEADVSFYETLQKAQSTAITQAVAEAADTLAEFLTGAP